LSAILKLPIGTDSVSHSGPRGIIDEQPINLDPNGRGTELERSFNGKCGSAATKHDGSDRRDPVDGDLNARTRERTGIGSTFMLRPVQESV
jgi:hypothetical protein